MKLNRLAIMLTAVATSLAACRHTPPLAEGDATVWSDQRFEVTWSSVSQGDTTVSATSPLTIVCEKDPALSLSVDSFPENYPVYSSDQPLLDALYNRSIEIISQNRAAVSCHYPYALRLSTAYLNPDAAADPLRLRLDNGVIATEPGALPWPASSDRSAWIIAAAELCRVTGDPALLTKVTDVAAGTIDTDLDACLDQETGLLYGSQSYLLPQPMLYPEWAEPVDIYQSPCLGSNMIAAAASRQTAELMRLCHRPYLRYDSIANSVMEAVESRFYQPNLGYYSAFVYGYPNPIQLQATDNMAQMIGIVHRLVNDKTAARIVKSAPVSDVGIPTMFPMPGDYRNETEEVTRPVVQAYWNLAAAKVRDARALTAGVAWLTRLATFGPRRELTAPGIVALVFRVFAGMEFEHNGIRFSPFVPQSLPGTKRIGRFRYRDSSLDIAVRGYGDSIASFAIDGRHRQTPFFDASDKGNHSVEISLMPSRHYHEGSINISGQTFMPVTPDVKWVTPREALITNYNPAYNYQLMVNGDFVTMIGSSHYHMFHTSAFTTIAFVPVSGSTWTGFAEQPYRFIPDGHRSVVSYEGSDIDLRALSPATYMVTFTYRPDPAQTAVAHLRYGRDKSAPVVFLPSGRSSDRSSSVTITTGKHRSMRLEPSSGKLPHIEKIVFIKIS